MTGPVVPGSEGVTTRLRAGIGAPPTGRAGRAMRESLYPVEEALVSGARREARVRTDTAESEAREVLAAARAEAARVLAQARAEGEWAAYRAAAAGLMAARVEARGVVLEARRRAFEALRRGALEELARRAGTAEVHALLEREAAWARSRVGAGATVRPGEPTDLDVVIERGNRRVVMTAGDLVDRQLAVMGSTVEELWT
jgi:vacuolar-type H+-ATPase subunit E/Vma4